MLSRERIVLLMDKMINHQQKKVMTIARKFVPGITEEDARNSFDFPALVESQQFNFEDGILSGYISAKIALLQEIQQMREESNPANQP